MRMSAQKVFLPAAALILSLVADVSAREPGSQDVPPGLVWEALFLNGQFQDLPGRSYLAPVELLLSPDEGTAYIAHQAGKRVDILTLASGALKASVAMPDEPTGMALSADGGTLYVTCFSGRKPYGVVVVVRTASAAVTGRFAAGHSPRSPLLSPDQGRLYVLSQFGGRVLILDPASGKSLGALAVPGELHGGALTPDGGTLVVPQLVPAMSNALAENQALVHVIDIKAGKVAASLAPANGSQSLRNVALSTDGRYAYIPHVMSRWQVPSTTLLNGWMNSNALSVFDIKERKWLNTLLLDDVNRGAGNPWDIQYSSADDRLYLSIAGTREWMSLDRTGVDALARDTARQYNRFGAIAPYRIWSGLKVNGPRAIAVGAGKIVAAGYFSDEVEIVPLVGGNPSGSVLWSLGKPANVTRLRLGEALFYDASLALQGWHSCGSCHPGARSDGLTWDLPPNGLGNPHNSKSLVMNAAVNFKGSRAGLVGRIANGIRGDFGVEPDMDQVDAIYEYISKLEPVPSPHLLDGELSPEAVQGRDLFQTLGCATCHVPGLYSDLKSHVLVEGSPARPTPSLVEAWRSPPYGFNGRHATLEELFSVGGHGLATPLPPASLGRLVSFLKSL